MTDTMRPQRIDRGDPISAEFLRKVSDNVLQRLSVSGADVTRCGTTTAVHLTKQPRANFLKEVRIERALQAAADCAGHIDQQTFYSFFFAHGPCLACRIVFDDMSGPAQYMAVFPWRGHTVAEFKKADGSQIFSGGPPTLLAVYVTGVWRLALGIAEIWTTEPSASETCE